MIRPPTISTRSDTLFPYTTLFLADTTPDHGGSLTSARRSRRRLASHPLVGAASATSFCPKCKSSRLKPPPRLIPTSRSPVADLGSSPLLESSAGLTRIKGVPACRPHPCRKIVRAACRDRVGQYG